MNPRHITLATVATILTIVGSVGSGLLYVKNTIDNQQTQSINRALQREQHEQEIDRRLNNLEIVVRSVAAGESPRQRDLINQLLDVKSRVEQISQKQNQQEPLVHRFSSDQYPADAPSSKPPDMPQ